VGGVDHTVFVIVDMLIWKFPVGYSESARLEYMDVYQGTVLYLDYVEDA